MSLDSIYGSDDNNILSNDHDQSNTSKNNQCHSSNLEIPDNNNDESCPSVYVNNLSNLLSIHHISGTSKHLTEKLDSTLLLSTASSSGSTIISSQSKDIIVSETNINIIEKPIHEPINNALTEHSTQNEEQLMELQEDN